MGAECPNGHGWQCIVRNITADGESPVKPQDVIAHKLACGCTVGGPDYEEFQAKVLDIRNSEKLAIQAAKEQARKAIGAAYRSYHNQESDE